MKKLHINNSFELIFKDNPQLRFIVPKDLFVSLKKNYKKQTAKDELISADESFRDLDEKYGKVGVTIRGFRLRDELTQKQLAEKLKIKQTHVSEMENGKRTVGKEIAHRMAKLFKTSYRLFL